MDNLPKTRKKILIVITKSNWGGAQRYVYDLATSLPADKFEVVVVLGGSGMLKQKLIEKKIRIISLPHLQRNINLIKELISFKEFFMIFWREKPDILHSNSSKAGGISTFIARAMGVKKIIFTAHAWAFNENRNLFSRLLISFLHWFNILLSHQTIAVSKSVKDQVSHFPFIKNKIKVVHLGMIAPTFLSIEESRKELGINISKGEIAIGTIAELHPIKGLNYAIEALTLIRKDKNELFKKIHYYVIGQGDEKEKLQSLILQKRLQEKVTLLGFQKDAGRLIKAFDLFLLPSLSEALGYVLIEAGYAKVLVLASNVGGIPEIVENNVSGILFPPKNAISIKETIIKAMLDPAIQQMSNVLYQKITQNFGLERMVKDTLEIYNI